jgi:predicted branched-subunit amino acid permease
MTPASTSNSPLSAARFWDGLVGVVPLVPGVVAFGLVYGELARQTGLNLAATTMMSVLVFPTILTGKGSYWILRWIVG